MVLAFLAVLFFSSAAMAQIPMTLGWHQLSNTTVRSVCPSPGSFPQIQGIEGCSSVIDSWSGGVLDSKANRLIITGGGHAAYAGNEVYALNLGDGTANPTIQRINDPSTSIRDGCANGGTYSDGKPVSRHTYDHLAYLPDTDELFMWGGSLWECGNMASDLWTYSFGSDAWTARSNTNGPSGGGGFSVACVYESRSKLVYCHNHQNLVSYNRTNNAWTVRGADTSFVDWDYKTAVIDPVRKRYLLIHSSVSGTIYWYDISSTTATGLARQTESTNCSISSWGRNGFAYDPVQDKIIGWSGGNTIHVMDPTTFQCSTVTHTGGPSANSNGTYGRFRYVPRLNLFVVCNDVDANCYALRLTITRTIVATVDDEKNTYRAWGWDFSGATDTFATTDPVGSYTVSDPDIHGDTESDDAWQYHMQFRRSSNAIFQTRATAWINYLKNGYRACTGTGTRTFCYDRDNFGLDHWYGTGLIDYYEASGDSAALTEINALGNFLAGTMYDPKVTPYSCVPSTGCLQYGQRLLARHLLFATRWAELTGDATAIALRNQIVTLFTDSSFWDSTNGMYWVGEGQTDSDLGAGSYASGLRITASFYPALIVEAFHHVVRITGNATLKARIISIAAFVQKCGLDATYQYVGSRFGININTTACFQNHFDEEPVTFADPSLSISLVGPLVYGYKYTGTSSYLTSARTAFNRGTKGVYGSPTSRSCADTTVCNFVDTTFDSAYTNQYLALNRGQMQYVYRLFENGGSPTVIDEAEPPPVVSNVRRRRAI